MGLNSDPDPSFYLGADPHPESQTTADPDPGRQKVGFWHEKLLSEGKMSFNRPTTMLWSRIRMGPHLFGSPGSGSVLVMWIRIQCMKIDQSL